MSDTLFAYFKGTASNSDDTNVEQSSAFYYPPIGATQNVIRYNRRTLALDNGDTATITFAGQASSDWVGIMLRVTGIAPATGVDEQAGVVKLTTVGVNWDGITAITGVTGGYGTQRYPGIVSMVTTKVTSFTLTGLADGTVVEYLAMILASDTAI